MEVYFNFLDFMNVNEIGQVIIVVLTQGPHNTDENNNGNQNNIQTGIFTTTCLSLMDLKMEFSFGN